MTDLAQSQVPPGHYGGTRRDFLILTAGALASVGAAAAIWPFIDSLNPARDTLALSTTEVDLAPVQVGQSRFSSITARPRRSRPPRRSMSPHCATRSRMRRGSKSRNG